MKIYIVGIGMGGDGTLTQKAVETISSSDVLIGAERMLESFRSLNIPCIAEYRADVIADLLNRKNYGKVSVLMSGDCGFYSGAKKLTKALSCCDIEVISGISTPVYFCSKQYSDSCR